MMSDSLRLCGARNVFDDLRERGRRWTSKPSSRAIRTMIVAVAPPGSAAGWLEDWKRFGTMRAVRSGRLVAFEDSRLSRLGPSAVGGTEALCEVLNRGNY